MEQYFVRIGPEGLGFSAAHFITYGDGHCESLHGHNYRVAVEVEGNLGVHAYVVDFVALQDTLAVILRSLDHHVLLPTEHPQIRVTASQSEIVVTFSGQPSPPSEQNGTRPANQPERTLPNDRRYQRRWVFPKEDCVLLPLTNTTAELLATYVGQQLQEKLLARTGLCPKRMRVDVEESPGRTARYTLVL